MKWNFLRLILVIQLIFSPQIFSQEKTDDASKFLPKETLETIDKIAAGSDTSFEMKMSLATSSGPLDLQNKVAVISEVQQLENFQEDALKQPAIIVSEKIKSEIPEIKWEPVQIDKGETLAYSTGTTKAKVKTIWQKMKNRLINNRKIVVMTLNLASTLTYTRIGYFLSDPNPTNLGYGQLLLGVLGFVLVYNLLRDQIGIFFTKNFRSLVDHLYHRRSGDAINLPESSSFERLIKMMFISTAFYATAHGQNMIANPDHRPTDELIYSNVKANFWYGISSSFELLTTRAINKRYEARISTLEASPSEKEKERIYDEVALPMNALTVVLGGMQSFAMMLADQSLVAFSVLVAGSTYVTFELFRLNIWQFLNSRDIQLLGLTRRLNQCGSLF